MTGALAWRGVRKEGVALWGVCAAVTGPFPGAGAGELGHRRGVPGHREGARRLKTAVALGGLAVTELAEERTRLAWALGHHWSEAGGAATEGGSGGQRAELGTEGGMLATKGGSGQGLAWPTRTDRA